MTHIGTHEKLGTSKEYMAEVLRCRTCGACWEVPVFSFPTVISRDRALLELPDLDARERDLGIRFPEPPPLPADQD